MTDFSDPDECLDFFLDCLLLLHVILSNTTWILFLTFSDFICFLSFSWSWKPQSVKLWAKMVHFHHGDWQKHNHLPGKFLCLILRITLHTNRNKNNHAALLLAGPVVPEPWDSLLDTESEEWSVVGRGAGGGTASDFSDRFSLRVLRTTVMSSWLRISCWEQT